VNRWYLYTWDDEKAIGTVFIKEVGVTIKLIYNNQVNSYCVTHPIQL